MSDYKLSPKPRILNRKSRLVIVSSRFNSAYTDALVENCLEELARQVPDSAVDLHQVPGAFEIPFAVEYAARHFQPDAIIALGVIIRGETGHGDLVAASVTEALQRSATDHLIPVIHEVLLVDNKQQAEERTMGERLNRGREAARACAMMLATLEKFRKSQPPRFESHGKEKRRA